jgi:sugar/nucleoside kinase (ribokinase family)
MTATASGAGRLRRWPSIPADAIVDPTGAGDVFLATLFAARFQPRLIRGRADRHLDLRLAAAAASLVLERPGLLGVPDRVALRDRVARTSSGT